MIRRTYMMYIYADDILDNYVKIGKIEKKKKKKKNAFEEIYGKQKPRSPFASAYRFTKSKISLRIRLPDQVGPDQIAHPLTGSSRPRFACASAYGNIGY